MGCTRKYREFQRREKRRKKATGQHEKEDLKSRKSQRIRRGYDA